MPHVYHPETGAHLMVSDDALLHMRASGWMTLAEWESNQVAGAERQAAQDAAQATTKTAPKEK